MPYAPTAHSQVMHMQQNGVTFDLMSPEEAECFLTTSNFFFKVKAFDKCFDKYSDPNHPFCGKYISLDFAYLVDLSRKDAVLREAILNLALDLEHYLKVAVNRVLMTSTIETQKLLPEFIAFSEERALTEIQAKLSPSLIKGFRKQLIRNLIGLRKKAGGVKNAQIACSFFDASCSFCSNIDYKHTIRSLEHLGHSSYSHDLVKKYGSLDSMEPWHFMEMASFGDFINFYKFLFYDSSESECLKTQDAIKEDFIIAKKIKRLLFPAKTLRNAAAHNDCLLNTLSNELRKPISVILKNIDTIVGADKAEKSKTWRCPVVHDFAALLICYDTIVPLGETRYRASEDLEKVSKKLSENLNYYELQENVLDALKLLVNLSKHLSVKWSSDEILQSLEGTSA